MSRNSFRSDSPVKQKKIDAEISPQMFAITRVVLTDSQELLRRFPEFTLICICELARSNAPLLAMPLGGLVYPYGVSDTCIPRDRGINLAKLFLTKQTPAYLKE